MRKTIHLLIYYLLFAGLIDLSSSMVYRFLTYTFHDLPDWTQDATIVTAAVFFTAIFWRYHVTIDIHMNKKHIFRYNSKEVD